MLELHPRASLSGTPFMRRARFRLHYATLPAWPNDDRFPKWVRAGSIAVRPTRRGLQFWVPVALEDLRRRRRSADWPDATCFESQTSRGGPVALSD